MYSLLLLCLYSLFFLSDASQTYSNFSRITIQHQESRIISPKFFHSASQQNIPQQPQRQQQQQQQNIRDGLEDLRKLLADIKNAPKGSIQVWNGLNDRLEGIVYGTYWQIQNDKDFEIVLQLVYESISKLLDYYDGFTDKSPTQVNRLLHLASKLSNEWKMDIKTIGDNFEMAFDDRLEILFINNGRSNKQVRKVTKTLKNVKAQIDVAPFSFMVVVCLNSMNGIFENIPSDNPMIIVENYYQKTNNGAEDEARNKLSAELQHLHISFPNAIQKSRVKEYSIEELPESDPKYVGTFNETPKSPSKHTGISVEFDWYLPIQILTLVSDVPLPKVTAKVPTESSLSPTSETRAPLPTKNITDTEDEIQSIYQTLQLLTNTTSDIQQTDFELALDRTEVLLESLVVRPEIMLKLTLPAASRISTNAFRIVDKLISTTTVWRGYNFSSETKSSNKVFNIFNSVAEIMNTKVDKTLPSFQFYNDNLFSRTERFQYFHNSSLTFNISDHQFPVELVVPFTSLNFTGQVERIPLDDVSATFSAILRNPKNGFLDIDDEKVNSNIFALVLEKSSFLVDEFYFRIHHHEKLQFGDESVCSFWNKSALTWWTTGCRLDEDQSTRTLSVCYCSHTTNFAAIMDVSHREINDTAKSILTYICSTITIIATGLAMYLPYRYPHRRQNENDKRGFEQNRFLIVQNICGTLIVSHLFIMFGMDRTEASGLCVLSAIFLFFFLLATFVFMLLMLGLFFMTISELTFRSIALEGKHIFIAGYSVPAVIVVFSVIIIFAAQSHDLSQDLCGEYFCWLASKKRPNNLWFFVVPVILIMITNCVLTGLLFTKTLAHKKEDQKRKMNMKRIVITFVLFTLTYGLPWLLFVFYINRKLSSFAYIFILINGLQGITLLANQAEIYWKELTIDFPGLKKMYRPQKKGSSKPEMHSNSTLSTSVQHSSTSATEASVQKSNTIVEHSISTVQVREIVTFNKVVKHVTINEIKSDSTD